MSDQAWMDSHYPRCVRCGLRTYVSNLTGARCAEVTGSAQCPAYNLPESERPEYPYVDSLHTVVMDKSAGQRARETPPEGSDPSLLPNSGSTEDPRGTCATCGGPLGEDNVNDVCGPCVAEIVEPEAEPCGTFRSIGVGRLGDAERAMFCRCGWEYADHGCEA